MGVLQRFPHPLPIKTDSGNNILIYSPEMDGPAHAAQPFSSWADLSALQCLPLKLRRPSSAHVPGWPDFSGWAEICSWAGPGGNPTGRAAPGRRIWSFIQLWYRPTELLVTVVYWHRSAQQWEYGTYADDKQASWNMMFGRVDRNYHGYVRNRWQMSRRGAGMRLSPGAFYSTNHICLSQMEAPSYTRPRLEQNCDIPPAHIKTTQKFWRHIPLWPIFCCWPFLWK